MILLPNTQELELAQQKEISHFKADMEPEGGTEPIDSPDQELSEDADVTDKIDCVYEEDTEECTLVSSI